MQHTNVPEEHAKAELEYDLRTNKEEFIILRNNCHLEFKLESGKGEERVLLSIINYATATTDENWVVFDMSYQEYETFLKWYAANKPDIVELKLKQMQLKGTQVFKEGHKKISGAKQVKYVLEVDGTISLTLSETSVSNISLRNFKILWDWLKVKFTLDEVKAKLQELGLLES